MWDDFQSGILHLFRAESLWRRAWSLSGVAATEIEAGSRRAFVRATFPGPAYPAWLLGDEDQEQLGLVKPT
jgi:hypothetical protein